MMASQSRSGMDWTTMGVTVPTTQLCVLVRANVVVVVTVVGDESIELVVEVFVDDTVVSDSGAGDW
jgi:hypothetical protein